MTSPILIPIRTKGEQMKKYLFTALAAMAVMIPLSGEIKVLAFAGSTRADSYNKQLVLEAATIARKMGATVTVIDLKDYPMPFYDGDVEAKEGLPKNAVRLRQQLIASDAVIIASPEYNHSLSAVLKNTIDWTSRTPEGRPPREAYKGKRFALMATSPGKGGGRRGLGHLRQIIEDAGGTVVSKEVFIPDAAQYFSDKNRPENPALKEEIRLLLLPKEAVVPSK